MDLSVKSRRKQRLAEFLRQNLDDAPAGRVVEWVDRAEGVFRILWTHQSSGSFTSDDAALFRYWALARGKQSNLSPVELKQSLRMALNKSPSVERVTDAPQDEYRYFRFTDWKTKLSNHNGNSSAHLSPNNSSHLSPIHQPSRLSRVHSAHLSPNHSPYTRLSHQPSHLSPTHPSSHLSPTHQPSHLSPTHLSPTHQPSHLSPTHFSPTHQPSHLSPTHCKLREILTSHTKPHRTQEKAEAEADMFSHPADLSSDLTPSAFRPPRSADLSSSPDDLSRTKISSDTQSYLHCRPEMSLYQHPDLSSTPDDLSPKDLSQSYLHYRPEISLFHHQPTDLSSSYDMSRTDLSSSYDMSRTDLSSSYDMSRKDLSPSYYHHPDLHEDLRLVPNLQDSTRAYELAMHCRLALLHRERLQHMVPTCEYPGDSQYSFFANYYQM